MGIPGQKKEREWHDPDEQKPIDIKGAFSPGWILFVIIYGTVVMMASGAQLTIAKLLITLLLALIFSPILKWSFELATRR